MTVRPTRAELDGRSYLDLQNLARRTGRPTDELLQTYALEGFLARLAESDYADRLVVKGGVLLAAFGARRPTRDVDLQATALPNELEDIRRVICDVLRIERPDGLNMNIDDAVVERIRDEDAYSGARVSVQGRLARASLRFHVDVNIGDPGLARAGSG
jgi:predicted nucleotidyltransferase component of viral defense system